MEQLESVADTYPGQTSQLGERRPRFTAWAAGSGGRPPGRPRLAPRQAHWQTPRSQPQRTGAIAWRCLWLLPPERTVLALAKEGDASF